jgi:hypothetical protein
MGSAHLSQKMLISRDRGRGRGRDREKKQEKEKDKIKEMVVIKLNNQ